MKDPNEFTVLQLKEKLRQLNLSTNGNKAELIARLHQNDPTGQWIDEIEADTNKATEEEGGGATANPNDNVSAGRELEFARKERELLQREIELMRRENEQLRATSQVTSDGGPNTAMSKVSLTNLKEMLPSFDGKKG
ncbi:hypothetical protein ALC57_18275 [Trachymyrmex cornetzi]|uniref:SAP domain-containing protein n=1 Tax=Trachymyrmex cornetzi TaxID=471704 RepID=A0A151ISB0_9HYME|nr:hypothetical protein ALC57_18275 [Trachymyrmex cornetzi]